MSTDVIVLGLGAMGSAAAAHLAARGQRVLGIEQFTPAHDRGSSHGETRLIRQAYFEDPRYVPLLLRSYELWADLDAEFPGVRTLTGGLMLGSPDSDVVSGSVASAEHWGLDHELLDHEALRARYPMLTPAHDTVGVYERAGGWVDPERTVLAHLERARALGAQLSFGERALSWTACDGHVEVHTDRGTYEAGRLVVSAGAWAPQLLPELARSLLVERQLLFWFAPRGGVDPFRAPDFPVFVWEDGGRQLYGFPAYGGPADGVKVAFFRNGSPADPDRLDRVVRPSEVSVMRSYLASRIPDLPETFLRSVACMYTTTPDENFVLGPHPEHAEVVVAAGFSGHGFKFVPVVGEILADLTLTGATPHDIGLFDPKRF